MQLKDKDGIACDHCGTTYRTDFQYFSFDFRLLAVSNNRRPSLDNIFRSQITFSLDICTACFEKIKDRVVEHYGNSMHGNSKQIGRVFPFFCELTGKKLAGTFNYYHCNVVYVNVKMSGQPNICVNCQTQTMDENKPCKKCEGLDFVRLAITRTDDRYVEINVSEEAFRELVNKAENIRKVAGEWETKS